MRRKNKILSQTVDILKNTSPSPYPKTKRINLRASDILGTNCAEKYCHAVMASKKYTQKIAAFSTISSPPDNEYRCS